MTTEENQTDVKIVGPFTTIITEESSSSSKTDTELILEKIAQLEKTISRIGPFSSPPAKPPKKTKVAKVEEIRIGPFSSPPPKPPKPTKVTKITVVAKEENDSWW